MLHDQHQRLLFEYSYETIQVNVTQTAEIPDKIIKECNLDEIVTADGYIYITYKKGCTTYPKLG
jgi:hypothetical protein